MIDAMFQEGTDAALDDQVRRAKPGPFTPPAEPGAFAGFGRALLGGGLGAAAAETIAFGSEILGAFGQTLAATGGSGGGMFAAPTPTERTQQEKARAKLVERGGIDFSNEAGDLFRSRAKDLMPDPMTTGLAGQIVGGLYRFGGKAVGYTMLGGPAVGAFGLAGDEAFTESDKLKQQDVPLGPRSAVGLVSGVASGLAMALPVAGKTIKETAALVVAGGPASFMAQQAASRAILEHADYAKIGSTYDPFDPVGLAVSTLVPAGFGAVALRGRRSLVDTVQHLESRGNRYGKDGQLLTSPKGAQGEMQVMPGTSGDPGFGVAPAKDKSPEELARVGRDYIAAMQKRYGDDAQALAAYNAGPGAVDKAIKAKGGAWLSVLPKETRDYVANGMRRQGADAVRAATEARPELVDAARVHQVQQSVADAGLHTPGDLAGAQQHFDAVARASDQIAAGEPVHVADMLGQVATDEQAPAGIRGYHGTKADEASVPHAESLTRSVDLGPHFTTDPDTAAFYAGHGGTTGRVLEADLSFRRSLEMPDLAGWNALNIANWLDKNGHTAHGPDKQGNLGELGTRAMQAINEIPAKDIDARDAAAKAVVSDWFKERGYDSIKYTNRFEGKPVDTYIALDMARVARPAAKRLADFGRAVDELRDLTAANRMATTLADSLDSAAGGKASPRQYASEAARLRASADQAQAAGTPDIAARNRAAADMLDARAQVRAASEPAKAKPGAATLTPEQATIDRAASAAIEADPGMEIRLDGMEHAQPAREVLDMVRREAEQDIADSEFLQVAAECFLRNG